VAGIVFANVIVPVKQNILHKMASSLCPNCRDWVAYGLVIGPFRCEWIYTDSKHIDPHWGQVRLEEIFIGIYSAKPGDIVWKRDDDIVGTECILSFYEYLKENPQVEFEWWIKDDKDPKLLCLKDYEFPDTLSDRELSLDYLNRVAPFRINTI
jgi:hypothetical protein